MAQKQPIFSKPARSFTDAKDYISSVDELTKKNRGSSLNVAEDTGANLAYRLPGKRVKTAFGSQKRTAPKQFELPPKPEYDMEIGTHEATQDQITYAQQNETYNARDVLDQINQTIAAPNVIGTSKDGGAMMQDGSTYYPDGSVKTPTGELVTQIPASFAQLPAGMGIFSDGSVRYLIGEGLQGLSDFIFGKQQTVTQPYANPSDLYASGVHSGTDFRTKDYGQPYTLASQVKVVDSGQWDGLDANTTKTPYGNWVLVMLDTGEMLRLSHLSDLGKFQPGDVIEAGQVIGNPGNTGHSYGQHLDAEYFAPGQTKPSSPDQFMGFTNPALYTSAIRPGEEADYAKLSEEALNSIDEYRATVGIEPIERFSTEPVDPTAPVDPTDPIAPVAPEPTAIDNILTGISDTVDTAKVAIADTIDALNPTGEFDLGITQTLRDDPEAAAAAQINTIENVVGGGLNLPEIQTGELVEEQDTNPFAQLIGNLVDVGSTAVGDLADKLIPDTYAADLINTDYGFSESIPDARTTNTALDLAPSQNVNYSENIISSQAPQPEDYGKVFSGNVQTALKGAGQGIKNLFSKGVGLFSKPASSDISGERAVGQGAGGGGGGAWGSSNVLPGASNAKMDSVRAGNDVRDPFFKQGGAEQFANYLQPGAGDDGALTLDMFSPSFFESGENVKEVFSSTPHLQGGAMNKYLDSAKNQYRQQYSGGEYDQADVERILNSIPADAGIDYTPNFQEPKKVQKNNASLQDYLNMGKTAEQWYAETGRQGELDAIGRDPRQNIDMRSGNITRVGENNQPTGTQMINSVKSDLDVKKQYPGGVDLSKSSIRNQDVTKGLTSPIQTGDPNIDKYGVNINDGEVDMSFANQSSNKPSLFQRGKDAVSNIFRRVFN